MVLDGKIRIEIIPACAGDCFLIEFVKEDYRILIDGGYVETYHKHLKKILLELAKQGKVIDLLVITHIDSDHIGGIQAFLQENGNAGNPTIINVKDVWYNAFPHMYINEVKKQPIPYIIKEILNSSLAIQNIDHGRQDISVAQGDTVTKLLVEGQYNWNNMWSGKSVSLKNGIQKNLTDKIKCTLLNPNEERLQELAQFWISKLKNTVKNFVVCDDILYSEAFECYFLHNEQFQHEVAQKDIAFTENKRVDWNYWLNAWSGRTDESKTNRSSIAFLLEYDGIKMLFSGDCPIQLFREQLPEEIDIVKLPHHGSEKNISAEFIRSTKVSYYLLSTNGTKHDHPSKAVISNILLNAPGNPKLISNYDVLI